MAETRIDYDCVPAGLGRYDLALARFREGARLDPRRPEGYCNIGVEMMRKGDLEVAALFFGRALEASPGFEPSVRALTELRGRPGGADPGRGMRP